MNILKPLAVQLAIFVAGFVMSWLWLTVRDLLKNKKAEGQEDDNYPTTLTSSEAMDRKIELDSEFDRLVTEISHYQARAAGKEVTFAEAKAGVPDEKLISPKDIDAAFEQALKELQPTVEPQCQSCEAPATLLDKIRNLRKKYETQTPTP